VALTRIQKWLNEPGNIGASVDVKKAFDSIDRKKMIEQLTRIIRGYERRLRKHPEEASHLTMVIGQLKNMLSWLLRVYRMPTKTYYTFADGTETFWTTEGVRQGCPLSMLIFCVAIQHTLELVKKETGVNLAAYADDITICGTPEAVLRAIALLEELLLENVGLVLNHQKNNFMAFGAQPEVVAMLRARIKDDGGDPDTQLRGSCTG
jgi:hypothetical protein